MINGHGDEYKGDLEANFSSNVWHGANNSELYQHLTTILPTIARYPEADAADLQNLIAKKNMIDSNQVLVANGSTEAFYLIAQAYCGSTSLVVTPTFSEYADACKMHNHTVIQLNRTNLYADIKNFKPKLIWICNPNNPDGYCFTVAEILKMLVEYPKSIFIVDQAYIDFTFFEAIDAIEINKCPNLILVQSLTKRYAIPGLRLGYMIAQRDIIEKIEKFRLPWSVNSLAIEAGKFILNDYNDEFNIDKWIKMSHLFQKNINEVPNFETIPSQAPFFLVKLKKGKATDLKKFLIKNKILVRDSSNFEGLEGEYIRLCTLTENKNNLLISNLHIWNQNIY